jgi:hypothetical protein
MDDLTQAHRQDEKTPESDDRSANGPAEPRHASTRPQVAQRSPRQKRSGSGQSKRPSFRFEDGLEHSFCQHMHHEFPEHYPSLSRVELATRPPVEVARKHGALLLCNLLHFGPHVWPDGSTVE